MTARAALTVVGQVVGSYFGPVGAAIGGAIGSVVGGAIDGPVRSSQALIEDLGAIKFDYGSTWPRIYGGYRFKVSPMWSSTKRPIAHEEEQGKGGPSAVNTTFTYEQDWLCWAPLNAIGFARVWINGELKFTQRADSEVESTTASLETTAWRAITFFDGDPAQMPWTVYETSVGTENASAYRHRPTLAIEGLNLGGSGQPPLVEVEFYTEGETALPTTRLQSYFDDDDSEDISYYANGAGTLSGAEVINNQLEVDLLGFGPATLTYESADIAYDGSPVTVEAIVTFLSNKTVSYTRILNYVPNIALEGSFAFRFGFEADTLIYDDPDFSHVSSGFSPAKGVPFHIAVTSDATSTRVYVNGSLLVSRSPIALPGVTGRIVLGDPFGYRPDYQPDIHINYTIQEFAVRFRAMYTDDFDPPERIIPPDGLTVTPGPADLAEVVQNESLLEWSGESGALTSGDIDVTELEEIEVQGFATTGSPREAIAQLMDWYYFGCVCSDKLYFRLRGAEAVKTIAFDDTGSGVGQAGEPFTGVERGNDLEVAMQVAVTGPNLLTDYEPGTENSDRLIGESVELRRYTTAVVSTPAERKGRADTMVLDGRIAANAASLALDDRHIELECFDVVNAIDDEGNEYRLRIDRETHQSSGSEFSCVMDDASILSTVGITSATDSRALTVATPADTDALLLDIPMLSSADNTPGFYAAMSGASGWPGAVFYRSVDGLSFTAVGSVTRSATTGTCSNLADFVGWTWDEASSITVTLDNTSLALESSTHELMEADGTINTAAIGAHGRWEIVRFRNATLVGSGIYTLTGLLRGQLGTEHNNATHEADDAFVLLANNGILRVSHEATNIGTTRYYKAVTIGQTLNAAATISMVDTGVCLRPYAPVDLMESSVGTYEWHRRSRMPSAPTTSDPPLGETTERYDVELLDISDVVLESSTVSTAAWTPSGSGDKLRVYQMSEIVGRGYVAELEL